MPTDFTPPPPPGRFVPPPPPAAHTLPAGARLRAGLGWATVLADMDFETYSEAGYVWDEATQKWKAPKGSAQGKKGLTVVGAAVYAEHETAEVLSFSYDLKDGLGVRQWVPGMPPPVDLFDYLARGGLVEAHNKGFEQWIWDKVCVLKYGWPPLNPDQVRCSMAKARAYALPGKLEKLGEVLQLPAALQKDKEGDRLLKKFSVPQNPTNANKRRRRITLADDLPDASKLLAYNAQDIRAEAEVSSRVPDLEGEELQFWLLDQRINRRGVQLDVKGLHDCIAVVDQAHAKYNAELAEITAGVVQRASELQKLTTWLAVMGVRAEGLDEDAVDTLLASAGVTGLARRALELRQKVGSAAVKKIYTMANQVTRAGRLHDLFTFHGARTGRTTGNGPQPTNMPNSGPEVFRCGCGRHYGAHLTACPWCRIPNPPDRKPQEWGPAAMEDGFQVLASRDLAVVEYYFGDAIALVSGCLRGLFVAAEGHDLICSDYSAIEAVVLAAISGCAWRMEVFRTHGKIYEMSAAKISGVPFADFMKHAGYTDEELAAPDWYARKPKAKGSHHPLRKTIGKVAELASGYQGWVGAWIAFGADAFMTEDEMSTAILAWREASPEIVEFWGGQFRGRGRGKVPELYGVEGMFLAAMLNPGTEFEFRGFRFLMKGDAVYLRLLSGRYLTYHAPRLEASDRGGWAISYEGWNTNPNNGPVGWIRMRTWGGRLTENIVQATARDIQWHGMLNLERAGYPIVLHVYDEDIGEVPHGFGSVEEFERIMAAMPSWAADWPIKASGGWRGRRYRKD